VETAKKTRKKKPKFRLKFFGIGRGMAEEYLGEAHDAVTAMSLLKGAEARGFYAVSVHGTSVDGYGEFTESNEFSIASYITTLEVVKERGY